MAIWGSLIGGMIGFSLGGPFGMLLGSLIGGKMSRSWKHQQKCFSKHLGGTKMLTVQRKMGEKCYRLLKNASKSSGSDKL